MTEALFTLLQIPAISAAMATLVGLISWALKRRETAQAALLLARAALIDAEAQKMLAEARKSESEGRLNASEAQQIRRERTEDRAELRRQAARIEALENANREAEYARAYAETKRAEAEGRALAMRRDFATYHASANATEARAGRPPRHTPNAFAVDDTVPFGTAKGTT